MTKEDIKKAAAEYAHEDCTFADVFGRNCQHGMLFPVMVLMAYGDVYKCPNFEKKTIEQISEQIAQRE